MKLTKQIAIVLLIVATILTGLGGLIDMNHKSGLRITKKHMWNDGLFLVLVAIALLLL